MDPIRDGLLLLFVLVCTVNAAVYALLYLFRPWRSTPQGKALMVRAWGDLIVLSMAMAYAMFGEYPFRTEIRVVGFGVFMIGSIYLTGSLLLSPGARKYPPWRWRRP